MNLNTIVFLLKQTPQERNLTILYVCLFVLAMGMLVLDSIAMKKWTPKSVKGLLFAILIVSVIALIILFVSASKN